MSELNCTICRIPENTKLVARKSTTFGAYKEVMLDEFVIGIIDPTVPDGFMKTISPCNIFLLDGKVKM